MNDNNDDIIVNPASISAVPGRINGLTEAEYLLGAVGLVQRELGSAALRNDNARVLDASQRLDCLKDCLVDVLQRGEPRRNPFVTSRHCKPLKFTAPR